MPGPVTSAALAERMLHRADRPLWKLDFAMERCRDLHAEHAQDVDVMSPADTETQHRRLPGERAEMCAAALEVIEVSLIAVNHSLPGPHLPKLALDVPRRGRGDAAARRRAGLAASRARRARPA